MFIVLRDCPPFLPAHFEGRWYEVAHLNGSPIIPIGAGGLMFWPTGEHVVKGLGVVAAVYSPKFGGRYQPAGRFTNEN